MSNVDFLSLNSQRNNNLRTTAEHFRVFNCVCRARPSVRPLLSLSLSVYAFYGRNPAYLIRSLCTNTYHVFDYNTSILYSVAYGGRTSLVNVQLQPLQVDISSSSFLCISLVLFWSFQFNFSNCVYNLFGFIWFYLCVPSKWNSLRVFQRETKLSDTKAKKAHKKIWENSNLKFSQTVDFN